MLSGATGTGLAEVLALSRAVMKIKVCCKEIFILKCLDFKFFLQWQNNTIVKGTGKVSEEK